jgi:hypothetical protein
MWNRSHRGRVRARLITWGSRSHGVFIGQLFRLSVMNFLDIDHIVLPFSFLFDVNLTFNGSTHFSDDISDDKQAKNS